MTPTLRAAFAFFAVLALNPISAFAARGFSEKDWQDCERRRANLPAQKIILNLNFCQQVYALGGFEDNTTAWTKVIQMGLRSIEISEWRYQHLGAFYDNDPAVENTTYAYFNYWSAWKYNPESYPGGEHAIEDSIAVLKRAEKFNAGSATFYRITADHYRFLFWQDQSWAPQLIDSLQKVDTFTKDPRAKLLARLDLGRTYRDLGQTAEAIAWFRRALEINPKSIVALEQIRKLSAKLPSPEA